MKHLTNIKSLFLLMLPALIILFYPACRSYAQTCYYNVVTDFGADGTDSASDATAIQQALDMASEDHKIVVTIPDGTYYIHKILYVQSNTTIRLSSNAVIKRDKTGVNKNMLRTTDANHKSDKVGGYNLAHDITITGGTWDGGNIQQATKNCDLIYIGHARNITIENTTVKNCYGDHAIEYAGVKDSAIRNCTITGFRYNKKLTTSEAIQIDICYKSDADGKWAPGFKADKTTSKNIIIEKNLIIDYPRGIGVHHTLKGKEVRALKIRNNTIKRSSPSTQGKSVVGLFFWGVKSSSVTNNTFDHCSYGAMIKVSNGITLKNNKFKYNRLRNLAVESCNKFNGYHTFTVTQDDIGKKTFKFTCGGIKSGYIKTKGKKYNFKSKNGKVTVKLKYKIKVNQKVTFYGKDKYGNKYYRVYYVPKQTKKKK